MLNLRFSQKVLGLLCVPVLFQIGFVALLAYNLNGLEEVYKREAVVADMMADVNRFMSQLMTSAGAQTMFQMTRDLADKERFDLTVKSIEQGSELLHKKLSAQKLTKEEAAVFLDICRVLQDGIKKGEQAMASQDRVDTMVAFMHLRKAIAKVNSWAQRVSKDLDIERNSAAADQIRLKSQVMSIIVGGILGDIVLVVFLLYRFDRSTGRRFSDLMANIISLGVDRPLEKKVEGDDDFAQLDGVLHKVAASVRDLRRTEQAIIDNAVDVICSLDRSGRFSQVNPAAEKLWKMSKDELIGKNLVSLVAEGDRERTHAVLQSAIERGDSGSFDLKTVDKSGGTVEMLWNVFWSADMDRLFCVAHDVTERKQLERMKQEFVAMISHDVKSPLTSLQLTLGVLSSGKLGEMPEGVQSRLDRAETSVAHVVKLVGDLLEMEKLDSGVFQLQKERVRGATLIEESLGLVEDSLRAGKLSVHVKASADEISCDRQRMVRVITNLLSNAIKFSKPDGSIEIKFECDEKDALFEVVDQGRGVPHEKQSVIFERFRQIEADDEHGKKGSGLGLAICKAIVEAHGGSIGVKSDIGKGSCFWLRIPCS